MGHGKAGLRAEESGNVFILGQSWKIINPSLSGRRLDVRLCSFLAPFLGRNARALSDYGRRRKRARKGAQIERTFNFLRNFHFFIYKPIAVS
jgi:hypothetical protein